MTIHNIRRAALAIAAAGAMAGCSLGSLTDVPRPSNILDPDALQTYDGAIAMYNGALSEFNRAFFGGQVWDASLTGNLQRAIAYGNSATNTLGVSAGNLAAAAGPFLGAPASNVTVDALGGLPFSNAAGALPTVRAAYGVLNDQSVQANVNSSATGPNTFAATVNGNVSAAGVSNGGNAFSGSSRVRNLP